jgi:hypothetical protein
MSFLILNGKDESCSGASTSTPQRLRAMVILVLCLSAGLFAGIGDMATKQNIEDVTTKNILVEGSVDANNVCFEHCHARRTRRNEYFGGDLLDRKDLLGMVNRAKADLISKLKGDYGAEHFENIFVDKEAGSSEERYRGYEPVSPDGDSLMRLKRKFLIKVLSVQTSIKKRDSNVNGCDCMHGDKALEEKIDSVTRKATKIDATYQRYVWATGGHSAAAGHGNLYNESYTAFLERDLQPVFEAIGIEFEARNYAMGATR